MKKKVISLVLALCMLFAALPVAALAAVPTQQEAYEKITALQARYPTGTPWTNSNYYRWNGGIFTGGYGCAGFAFMLSDAAFGDLPARKVTNVDFDQVRVGDILRINNDSHSVIVLEKQQGKVVIAEGNYNSAVKWGRTLTASQVASANYMLTRYPAGSGGNSDNVSSGNKNNNTASCPSSSLLDMLDTSAWYHDAVDFVVSRGLMQGMGQGCFAPEGVTTRAQAAQILYNMEGRPAVSGSCGFTDCSGWYTDAVTWARRCGVVSGTSDTTFSPGASVTREQLAVMLNNYARYKGCASAAAGSLSRFSDGAVCSDWSRDSLRWAVGCGVLNGNSNGTLAPKANCSRAQVAAMLKNFTQNVLK